MSSDARSRLCPEHRSDSIPSKSCANCAQARRIDELEQTVEQVVERNERLAEHIKKLKSDDEDTREKTTPIAIPETESP